MHVQIKQKASNFFVLLNISHTIFIQNNIMAM